MAQLAVAAAGAAVGSLFGAPQVGWLVGSFIGSQLFAEQPRSRSFRCRISPAWLGLRAAAAT